MKAETWGKVATVLAVLVLLGTVWVRLSIPEPVECQKCQTCEKCEPEIQKVEVSVEKVIDYKQTVVNALIEELSEDKTLRTCEDIKFDADEIAVKRVYDGYTAKENTDGEGTIAGVKIKLNYDDGKCYKTLTCGLDENNELVC